MKLSKRPSGTLRIIGGILRSRIIQFNPDLGVRPTSDRVRETFFNWLASSIHGARCLDLFTGSGALSFEATSRGADSIMMCEGNPRVLQCIKENIQTLKLEEQCNPQLHRFKNNMPPISSVPYDIIFLDPPFGQEYLIDAITWCYATGAADKNTRITFEADKKFDLTPLPKGVTVLKHKKTRHVQYGILGMDNAE